MAGMFFLAWSMPTSGWIWLFPLSAVTIAVVVGVILGAMLGTSVAVLDELIMRILEYLQAFPAFILADGAFPCPGSGKATIVYVVWFYHDSIFARLIRSEILSATRKGIYGGGPLYGASEFEIIFKTGFLPEYSDPDPGFNLH